VSPLGPGLLRQQKLIRRRTAKGCFRAFLNNSWLGLAIFTSIALHYVFNT